MEMTYPQIAVFLGCLALITLSSRRIGQLFSYLHLPLISGYVFTGILAGPYLLGLIPVEGKTAVGVVDSMALGFIALSAGGELYLTELRTRMRSIRFVMVGLVCSTFVLGTAAVFALADHIPFIQKMPPAGQLAVSLLAGAILVARSPSSAIAVIHELRARGPFTQTVLGVTVVMDVVVIVVFSFNVSLADGLLTGLGLNLEFALLLAIEVLLSIGLGVLVWGLLHGLLKRHIPAELKVCGVLALGYGVFAFSALVRSHSALLLPWELVLEPLLACMIAGFFITNYGTLRDEFLNLLHRVAPTVYAVFFTLTGATLALDVVVNLWAITLLIFGVRLLGIFIGSFLGGTLAGDAPAHNRISWMAYVTQAGVGLGLAKEVAGEFSPWGDAFAAMMISVIVINQLVGPALFKLVITWAGEAHPKAKKSDAEAIHSALIFGSDGQTLALAHQLRLHDWEVKVARQHRGETKQVEGSDIMVHPLADYSLASLHEMGAGRAGALVCMLSDEENYRICETAYEHFGNTNLVVQVNDRANYNRFRELSASVVLPSTAIISLLDHYVRSPSAVSLLLGLDAGKDIVDLEVRNPHLSGLPLREVRLPRDILIFSLTRNGGVMKVSGHTTFEVGDRITASGTLQSLEQMARRVGG